MADEQKVCPVCGKTDKDCPNMELGQRQSRIDALATQGCLAAINVIKVQERTYGSVRESER